MGASLSQTYDREFFTALSDAEPAYAESCRLIAAEIHRRFAPESVVDWGCGAGLHLREHARLGADVLGIDGSRVALDLAGAHVPVLEADLRQPVELGGRFPRGHQLSLCIDVLEHIDEKDADAVLDNVVRGASLVILSCAPPNQGGHHHVNEQPRRYWVRKMDRRGWDYQRKETGALERSFLAIRERIAHTWMFHNLCIYRPAPGDGRPRQPARPLL